MASSTSEYARGAFSAFEPRPARSQATLWAAVAFGALSAAAVTGLGTALWRVADGKSERGKAELRIAQLEQDLADARAGGDDDARRIARLEECERTLAAIGSLLQIDGADMDLASFGFRLRQAVAALQRDLAGLQALSDQRADRLRTALDDAAVLRERLASSQGRTEQTVARPPLNLSTTPAARAQAERDAAGWRPSLVPRRP